MSFLEFKKMLLDSIKLTTARLSPAVVKSDDVSSVIVLCHARRWVREINDPNTLLLSCPHARAVSGIGEVSVALILHS